MFISLEWLRKYTPVTADTILSDLSLHTAEVESIVYKRALKHVVIGHVTDLAPHPNADKLRVAQVNVGVETKQIVCGAKNLECGMKVPVALAGAILPGNFEIKEAQLRGVASQGMICSTDELGLATERAEGIMMLPEDAPIGESVFSYLHQEDVILEIDNKSITNRPDLFGHYGLARECSVIYDLPLAPLGALPESTQWEHLPSLPVTIEASEKCKRYMAIRIDNIHPKVSPLWLSSSLEKVGIKSINSVVDVTNYIMMDLGQPLHAFDAQKVTLPLAVGYTKADTPFMALDDKSRTLSDDMLVIKDNTHVLALAGIMGGKDSAISEETTSIIMEAAIFHPTTIRKASQKLALRTDASMRFEKNLDPEMTKQACLKAIGLLQELHPEATISSALFDYYPTPEKNTSITIPKNFLQERIGNSIEYSYIEKILVQLGFGVAIQGEEMHISVPSWRATGDVSLPEDILEEVTRMIGFGDIDPKIPVLPITPNAAHPTLDFEERIRTYFAHTAHVQEVQHYSFYSQKAHQAAQLTTTPLQVLNPLSSEQEVLRTSLVPGLLHTAVENLKHRSHVEVFEIDHIYPAKDNHYWNLETQVSYEYTSAAYMVAQKGEDETDSTFFHAKALMEDLLASLHISSEKVLYTPFTQEHSALYPWAHPTKSAAIIIDNVTIGALGKAHPFALHENEADSMSVSLCEFSISALLPFAGEPQYSAVSLFPVVQRDFAFLTDRKAYAAPLIKDLANAHALIRSVDIVEVYEGEKVQENQKSLTLRFAIGSKEKTLSEKEIQEVVEAILQKAHTISLTLRA